MDRQTVERWDWLDPGLALLLIALALPLRLLYAKAVVFPPLDDPAFYLVTGENLALGRGLEVDALWSYHTLFPRVTHPSHEHWMPLTSGLVAAAQTGQRLVGGSLEALQVGQLPGLMLGCLLVPLTFLVGRRALPGEKRNRWVALGAALLVAANATLSYQSASADSSAPFALLAALALVAAVRRPGDQGGYLGAGLVIALAYLTRADGLLLLLAVPLAWWLLPLPPRPLVEMPDNPAAQAAWDLWPRERGSEKEWRDALGPCLANVLDLVVGFGLLVVPWLVRNYLAFGTPLPGSLLSQAWLGDYVDSFNYLAHPTWQSHLALGWPAILALRGQALLHNGGVFLLITFAWGLLALPGLWLLRREWSFFPIMVYGLLLFFGVAVVFPVTSMSGTFYHSLGALMPFLALAAMYAVQRGLQRFVADRRLRAVALAAVTVGFLALAGAQVAISLKAVTERHQADKVQFEAVAGWLAEHAQPGDVVMTSQPYTLLYASGHPTIVLPGNEPPDAAWQAAQRYGARFLVITQTFGRYPQVLHEPPDPRFWLLERLEGIEIYGILVDAQAPNE